MSPSSPIMGHKAHNWKHGLAILCFLLQKEGSVVGSLKSSGPWQWAEAGWAWSCFEHWAGENFVETLENDCFAEIDLEGSYLFILIHTFLSGKAWLEVEGHNLERSRSELKNRFGDFLFMQNDKLPRTAEKRRTTPINAPFNWNALCRSPLERKTRQR